MTRLEVVYEWILAPFQLLLFNPVQGEAIATLQGGVTAVGLVCLLRSAFQVWLLRRMARGRREYRAADGGGRLFAVLAHARNKARCRRAPRVFEFPDRRPLVFCAGLWRPALYLSPSVARELAADELEATLIHELLHVRRRDPLRLWCLDLVTAPVLALFASIAVMDIAFLLTGSGPGVGVARVAAVVIAAGVFVAAAAVRRGVDPATEIACDRVTASCLASPTILASALVRVLALGSRCAEYPWLRAPVAGFVRRRDALRKRILRLTRPAPFCRRLRASILWTAALATILVAATAAGTYHAKHNDVHWSDTGHPGHDRAHLCHDVCLREHGVAD